MSSEECLQLHKEDRNTVLVRYRYALEQALAQCGWMMTQEIVVLQALILLIVCAPWKNTRSPWTLSGIAMGIAQGMGLHSDSTSFNLDLVSTEVRRRVWWSLCQLDNRISEDAGLEPHMPLVVDTELPLHVNDADLGTENVQSIHPRAEFTEMTTSLVKLEFAQTSLRVKRSKLGIWPLSTSEIETLARDQIRRFEETYLSYLDQSSQIHRLCYLGGRLIVTKLWKMTYDASQGNADAGEEEVNEPLLFYNADVLEITHQFPDDFRQFGWFFRCKHTQWHAMAYLLIQLCKHTQGRAIDRAWQVLETVFGDSGEADLDDVTKRSRLETENRRSSLWVPLLRLFKRVRSMRMQALQAHSVSGDEARSISSVENMLPTPPNEALLGDPFLGSGKDFGDNMDWEQLDAWVQSFQRDLFYEQGYMDYETENLTGTLSWF